MHAVDSFGVVSLFQKTVLHLARHRVNAAYRWQDPQFVTHPNVTVRAAINLHIAIGRLRDFGLEIRLVAIRIQVAQICARVMGMNMLTRRNIHQRMANWQTVFNDVFAFRNIA